MSLLDVFRRGKKAPDEQKQTDPVTASSLMNEILKGYDTKSGKSVTSNGAMQVSAVFACIRVLAEQIGMLPCHIYKHKGAREKASDFYLYDLLLHSPNPNMTAQEFWECLIVALCFKGNFYAWKEKGVGDRIINLYPLNNGSVYPRYLEDWSVVYEVTFYDGRSGFFTQDDIWHVRGITGDGLLGLSPVSYAREAIGLAIATEEHGARMFSNGTVTSGALQTDQPLSQEAFDRLRKDFIDNHGGVDNAFKPMILEMGLKWSQMSMNADDAQFLETRKFQVSEIARIFRVPPHMIGDLERATFSNIEQQSLDFVTNAVMPYLSRIEQRISAGLLKPSERKRYYPRFDVSDLLRGDQESRFNGYATGIQWGILSPNECREREDLPPRTDGDLYLSPLNMTTDPKANQETNTDSSEGNSDADDKNA